MTSPSLRRTVGVSILAAVAVLATACGGSDSSDGGGGSSGSSGSDLPTCPVDALDDADGVTEITVWHAWVGLTQRTLENIAEEYNKSQDKVKVNVEAQGNYEEMLAKYESALADPEALPDIVLAEDTTTQFMIDSATILPAQACIDADPEAAEFYDQVLPAVIAGYTVEDVLKTAQARIFALEDEMKKLTERMAASSDPTLMRDYDRAAGEMRVDGRIAFAYFHSNSTQLVGGNSPGASVEPHLLRNADDVFVRKCLTVHPVNRGLIAGFDLFDESLSFVVLNQAMKFRLIAHKVVS